MEGDAARMLWGILVLIVIVIIAVWAYDHFYKDGGDTKPLPRMAHGGRRGRRGGR